MILISPEAQDHSFDRTGELIIVCGDISDNQLGEENNPFSSDPRKLHNLDFFPDSLFGEQRFTFQQRVFDGQIILDVFS